MVTAPTEVSGTIPEPSSFAGTFRNYSGTFLSGRNLPEPSRTSRKLPRPSGTLSCRNVAVSFSDKPESNSNFPELAYQPYATLIPVIWIISISCLNPVKCVTAVGSTYTRTRSENSFSVDGLHWYLAGHPSPRHTLIRRS